MSYILDALKKAERERGIARVPTLATVHDRRNIRRYALWIIAGALVLFAITSAWIYLRYSKLQSQPPNSQADISPKAGDLKSTPENDGTSKSVKVPASGSEIPEAKSSASPASSSSSKSPLPAYDAVTRKSAEPEPRASIARKATAILQESSQNSPSVENSFTDDLSDEEDLTADAPANDRNAAEAKPSPLKEAAAKMTLNIHVYSEAKDERLVFIDGKKYREGDYVAGQYLLEEITPEGAVLSENNDKVVLLPGRK